MIFGLLSALSFLFLGKARKPEQPSKRPDCTSITRGEESSPSSNSPFSLAAPRTAGSFATADWTQEPELTYDPRFAPLQHLVLKSTFIG